MPPPLERMPTILLIGPTGSGKTPLGEILEQRGLWGKKCLHFDFGANLRGAVRRNSPDGVITREDIDFLRDVLPSGALLEDDQFPIAERILASFMGRCGVDRQTDAGRQTDIVLNGLPRHVGQAEAVANMLDVQTVVCLRCSSETVLRRIASNAGGDRTGREDDGTADIRAKLAVFQQRTAPLVDYYAQRNSRIETLEVTTSMSPEQMWDILSHR